MQYHLQPEVDLGKDDVLIQTNSRYFVKRNNKTIRQGNVIAEPTVDNKYSMAKVINKINENGQIGFLWQEADTWPWVFCIMICYPGNSYYYERFDHPLEARDKFEELMNY